MCHLSISWQGTASKLNQQLTSSSVRFLEVSIILINDNCNHWQQVNHLRWTSQLSFCQNAGRLLPKEALYHEHQVKGKVAGNILLCNLDVLQWQKTDLCGRRLFMISLKVFSERVPERMMERPAGPTYAMGNVLAKMKKIRRWVGEAHFKSSMDCTYYSVYVDSSMRVYKPFLLF